MKSPTKIIVIGAGHAGLLAANLLRRYELEVWEANQALPENHAAILRFRSPAVSDALGVPFAQSRVYKAAWDGVTLHNSVTLGMANRYSLRATGEVHPRSVFNLAPEDRWLAPGDFTEQLARGVQIEFDSPANAGNLKNNKDIIFISTMPMPVLANLLGYIWPQGVCFNYQAITVFRYRFKLPRSRVVQTVYNCSDDGLWYRATVEGQELILECPGTVMSGMGDCAEWILNNVFGFRINVAKFACTGSKVQKYGKLLPTEEVARRNFIHWCTVNFHIYSLGRFATWRPNLLLDDLVKDVKVIDRLITSGDSYAHMLAASTR